MGVRAPILLIGGILVTLSLQPVLSMILILILPFIGVLVYFVSKKGLPLFLALQQAVDVIVRTVREIITGIRVIKALSKTDLEKERFSEVNAEVVKNEKKSRNHHGFDKSNDEHFSKYRTHPLRMPTSS